MSEPLRVFLHYGKSLDLEVRVRISAMLRLYRTREEGHIPPRLHRYNPGELGIQIPGGIT